MKKFLQFSLAILLFLSIKVIAQPTFPCNGKFLFTRQYPAAPQPNSYISQVDFIPGDINISNQGTINNPAPGVTSVNVNASVLHAGYIWAQNWNNTTNFELLRIAADFTTTPFVVTGMPANTTYNNAGVDKNGRMYILTNANPVQIYAIDLTATTATLVTGYPKTVTFPLLATGESVIWGDIAFDPITGRCYCWYHPTATVTPPLGLYEITNLSATTPALVKIGVAQSYTLGSLFFNDRGQLFGYGGTLGSTQDRIFAIDKAGGTATQYGLPDIAVTQSDGAACAFRISLDRQVSVPFLNIPKCGVDTFNYIFTTRNYTLAGATNITFGDTLDTRLSYAFNAATLQTQLQATYGAAVVVTLSSYGGGTNNRVNITGLNLPIGAASFILPVKVDANNFTASATIFQQAQLSGIATLLGGPNEPSNDPTTFNPKDATPIVITLSGSKCLPPISNNFINTPMPQGNAATAIPGLVSADPDGSISSYKIITIPLASEGVLSFCSNGTSPCTATVTNITANTVLTPAQMATLKFDPASNFVGTAQFTFNATDNSGLISNTATYQLPVTAQPPVSNNIMENSMVNTNGPTPITPLNSTDVDGTISSYQITSLPAAAQGVLSVPCVGANPTLTGSTCTGGFQDLTPTVLANYPAGIPLTAAQIAGLRFDPTAGFVGNATFNYNATDNSGNISNTANYTIPVAATATIARPPLADNITAQPINNSNGPVAIPSLKANDLDGTVVSYTIQSFPPSSQGILSYCSNGTSPCTGTVIPISGATVLTPAQAATLKFDPAAGFVGNATFTYIATDNTGLQSNVANYTIPIVNTPPTAININTVAPFNGPVAAIVPLSGTDLDGTVDSLKVTSLPTGGVLSVPCPPTPNGGSACTGGFSNLTSIPTGGIALTPTQAAAIRFAPNAGFSGTTTFNYISKDNNSNISSQATYTITVPNQPPVSNDLTAPVMPNTNGPTLLAPLSSTDPDGTISSYTIFSLPPSTSGALIYCNNGTEPCTGTVTNVIAGTVLTAAQMATLKFDPAANYTGVVNFTYGATDNSGNVSNVANYNIPISGVGNLPPIANNIVAPVMPNTNAATAIPTLNGSDPDGTVANFTINTIPPASQGVLSYCSNGTSPCTGTITAVTAGTVLTAAQAATLKFDPTAGFVGNATFSYFDTDNSGVVSNLATYTLPVSGTPPISNPIVAPAMPQNNGATAIPGLVSSDADGSIANYTIETVPPASQGTLTYCSNGTSPCTGTVTTLTAGTVLSAIQMATLKFTPSGSYQGNVIFNYHAIDNSGLLSNSTTYTIPVTGQPPVSQDVLAPKMNNSNGPTAIPSLVSNDPDGTIASFVIASFPPASQGVLSYCSNGTAPCTGSFINITSIPVGGLSLTQAQIATLQFDPTSGFNGNAIFNYAAYDNNGNISNVATYTIPVGTSSVLAVSLVKFSGIRNGDNILLNWVSENEINISNYEVEVSTDGIQFYKAGNTLAKNQATNSYGFMLYNYTLPIYYIRLKILDNNGKFAYSNIIAIRNNSSTKAIIYPTPAVDFIKVELGSSAKGDYTFTLLDASGKMISNQKINNIQPNEMITISRNNIASGFYILKISNAATNEIIVSKVVFK